MGLGIRGLVRAISGNVEQDLLANRLGHQIVDRSIQAYVDAGMGYTAGIGLLSAGEALPAAAITTKRPQLWVRVPSGTAIKPFFIGVQVEDSGANNAFEIAAGLVRSDVGNGTSSAADFGPLNLRSDMSGAGNCTARQEATADTSADPDQDMWRIFAPWDTVVDNSTAGEACNFEWNGVGGSVYPLLIGPATFAVYIGSSAAPTVTAQIAWVEGDPDLMKARI